MLVFASGAIVWEAIHRFLDPAPVQSLGLVPRPGGLSLSLALALD